MFIKQLYTGCLSEAAYYIESNGEAAVVDPLKDENGKDSCVFTGDTLFVGDVGRPDLAQKGSELTMNDLAGMLYESLQKKIVPLADDVIVYPAHGPGSSCGKNLGPETYSTIGEEKH